jgi:phosphoribosylformimino-5-aminoimidazole carboxamide ribotide isomerase
LVIPALDIQGSRCVRLTKGDLNQKTIYYENPIDALHFWESQGTERIHVVDLDGAFNINTNYDLIEQMVKQTKIKIQVGGGIRDLVKAEKLINLGVDRIVIGTTAVKNPDFVSEVSKKIGKNKTIVALDHKNGKPVVQGWVETVDKDLFQLAKIMQDKGAGMILISSAESDGAFTGPDLINTKKMLEAVKIPVIAAGGVRNKQDIIDLKKIGVFGVIIGKAFYENRLKYSDVKNI